MPFNNDWTANLKRFLNLIWCEWFLPLDRTQIPIRCVLSWLNSSVKQRWVLGPLLIYANSLCLELFVLTKKRIKSVEPTDVKYCQMDSEKFPSEESLSSDLFKRYFEVLFLFTVPSVWQCEIRFITSFCYSEISRRRDFLTTGRVHQCWNALLSLSFFVRCMRPHFSELFRSKLSGKSARRVSRACAVNTTIAGLCISSIQRSVKQSPSVLVLQTARAAGLNPSSVQLHHCCSWAGTANLPRAREHLCVRLCECQSGVLLAVLFGDSLTKAVSARALSGSSHHSSTTLPVLSLGLLSMRTEIANPNLMMLCPDFVIQSPSPAVPPDNPAHIVFMANIF